MIYCVSRDAYEGSHVDMNMYPSAHRAVLPLALRLPPWFIEAESS